MARIEKFNEISRERIRLHEPIEANYVRYELDGRKLLQIDTAGSDDRKLKGKISQSLQFDEDSARQLYDILRSHFRFN